MQLELMGPHPFAQDGRNGQATRIGTLFPAYGVLCTQLPGMHALQRLCFIDRLNAALAAKNLPPLKAEEEEDVSAKAVDLIFEADCVLIRPDPDQMGLAFAADELLQTLVSKRKIKFLSVSDKRVRGAIKRRGEYWRLSSIPKTREGKEKLVSGSKVGIAGLPLYYYNRLTGTRWLTFQEFENLGKLSDPVLAQHLQEIASNALLPNRMGRPEVDFFATDLRRFGARTLAGIAFDKLPAQELHSTFEDLKQHFRSAVHEAFRQDDYRSKVWCERMLSTLFLEGNESQTEQVLSGLSPEFFLQIEWLPGGRFEEREFLFDSIFDEAAAHPEDTDLLSLCDVRAKGVIYNIVREYGDLEYINIGCLRESLSLERPQKEGRRGVYIAEFRSRSEPVPIKRFIRLQKWGVWEHLDEGKDLLQAIKESDDYTDYCLDRRLGCCQMGMNLTRRVVVRRLIETYRGKNARYHGELIRAIYFEREYLPGVASDKLPVENYSRPGYALRLAGLLGRAAVASMIVGRAIEPGDRPVFDDGDEVIREGEDGLPADLMLADHSGAFYEYKRPLESYAAHYARPINVRAKVVPEPVEFARTYLTSLREQFLHIQSDYRKHRRAFDNLFKHCPYDTGGSFAYRWECTLHRLDQTNVDTLVEAIRSEITVLNRRPPEAGTVSPSPVPAAAA
jgi:hypothetical protein